MKTRGNGHMVRIASEIYLDMVLLELGPYTATTYRFVNVHGDRRSIISQMISAEALPPHSWRKSPQKGLPQ